MILKPRMPKPVRIRFYGAQNKACKPPFAERGIPVGRFQISGSVQFVKSLYAFCKRVIGVLGIKVIAKKRHHEPPHIKANLSTVQKISEQFAIKKGGAVNSIETHEVYKGQYTSYQLSNDQKERGTYKYHHQIGFKLQHW